MAINPTNAAQAYINTVRNSQGGGLERRDSGLDNFGSMLENAVKSTAESAKAAERLSISGITGNTDVAEVVTAVANAEVALQTVIAVRDRVIQAYQDIARMPI